MKKTTASQPTVTLPADIAQLIGERMRADIEYAAEQAADYRTKAHGVRKSGNNQPNAECAAVFYAEADKLDRKADRWDAEFKTLERVCIALTRAGA